MAILLMAFPLYSQTASIPDTAFLYAHKNRVDNSGDRLISSNEAKTSISITVTNTSDIVNGNTLNIDTLFSNPGPDGISFREAINASNGTSGLKTIGFHPSLTGDSITIIPVGELFLMSSGELTINGDITGDGNPDITLDGHLAHDFGPALRIVSS